MSRKKSLSARCIALAPVFLLLLFIASNREAYSQAQKDRPAYQKLRFEEDWSFLAQTEDKDRFDPIKYIPVNDTGSIWLSFGGQVRERLEGWNNFNSGAPGTADDTDVFLLSRFLYHGDLHLGRHFRVFVQGKSAFSTDRSLVGGRRASDVDELALQNAFFDLTFPVWDKAELTIRGGRRELLFGKERLVSPSNWTNTRRTFQGVSSIFRCSDWRVTGFWNELVNVRKYDFNKQDPETQFYGMYAAGALNHWGLGLDLFWLGIKREEAVFNDVREDAHRQTFGTRVWSDIPGTDIDYEVIGAYQFGELGGADVSAFMVTVDLGYRFADLPGTPRTYLGFDYASGDDKAGDDRIETFDKLFPTGHAYLGYIDVVGRQNVVDLRGGVSIDPFQKVDMAVDLHNFWRADDDDALYSPGGGVVRPGFAGSANYVGTEIDLTLHYRMDAHTTWQAGYSRFFAEDFIEESGPSDDIDFVYLLGQFTF